jgi:o-succinylbenzoate synthase
MDRRQLVAARSRAEPRLRRCAFRLHRRSRLTIRGNGKQERLTRDVIVDNQFVKIERIDLIHVRVPLIEPFRISSGAVAEKDGIVVRVRSDGLTGYGESSPMAGTFYSSDTPESCWRELCESVVPAAFEKNSLTALELPGSNFARAGVETALWDLEAQRQGLPLYKLLGGTRARIQSGLAVGLYDTPADMLRVIERYLADGYRRVKIKIEPGRDVALVRAVRDRFGEVPLFVDANGAYGLEHVGVFRELDEYGLMMFEQPFPGPMLQETAELQRQVRTPVCLDESLESVEHLERAVALGAVRIVNIKIQRVGGLAAAVRMYELCRRHSLPVWVGTMPELGIGCAQGAALASLDACTLPTDVEASLRWFTDDIIEPLLKVRDGCIDLPGRAGLGYTVDESKLELYKMNERTFRA